MKIIEELNIEEMNGIDFEQIIETIRNKMNKPIKNEKRYRNYNTEKCDEQRK